VVAEQIGGTAAQALTTAANEAFVVALGHTVYVGAGVALLGALIALIFLPSRPVEEAADLVWRTALDERLVRPVRARFVARLEVARSAGQIDPSLDLDLAADLLAGPVYYRALITGDDLDGDRIGPALDLVLSSDRV
jgi:hypothetical protein